MKEDVLTLLKPIKDKWYNIGDSLDVHPVDLENLYISKNTTEMNLSLVINKWLENKSNEATWKTLLKELEGPIVNNCEIGNDVRTFLKSPHVYAKYVFAVVSECIITYLLLVYM